MTVKRLMPPHEKKKQGLPVPMKEKLNRYINQKYGTQQPSFKPLPHMRPRLDAEVAQLERLTPCMKTLQGGGVGPNSDLIVSGMSNSFSRNTHYSMRT
jgi:hypothetical protein